MKAPKLNIRAYKHLTSKFYVAYLVEGKRHREFFRSKKDAETWVEETRTKLANEGQSALTIPDELRIMAVKCAADLRPFGKTIADAARFYIAHLNQDAKSCTINDLKVSFILAKRQDGVSDSYLADLESRLGRFAKDFGTRSAASFDSGQVDDWLRGLPLAPVSRNNFRTVLHALFTFAVDRGCCAVNPMTKTSKARIVDKAPEIFTPEEARKLLSAATPEQIDVNGDYILPSLAIGLFAGLRRAEIERLDWSEVNLARCLIEVKAMKAKSKQRRHIEILPNLKAWLTPFAKERGPVVPPGARNKMEVVCKKADVKWKDNALRHSFASYHLAHFKDVNILSVQMGHVGTGMLFGHYRELVLPDVAERYWDIYPSENVSLTE